MAQSAHVQYNALGNLILADAITSVGKGQIGSEHWLRLPIKFTRHTPLLFVPELSDVNYLHFSYRSVLCCSFRSILKPGIHDASFASKSPFKFFDRVYHTRNLNQKT